MSIMVLPPLVLLLFWPGAETYWGLNVVFRLTKTLSCNQQTRALFLRLFDVGQNFIVLRAQCLIKGVVVQGNPLRPFSCPLILTLRMSKTTWLAICQGQRRVRMLCLNHITRDVKVGGGRGRSLFSQFCPILGTWSFHPGDLLYLAHRPCSAMFVQLLATMMHKKRLRVPP